MKKMLLPICGLVFLAGMSLNVNANGIVAPSIITWQGTCLDCLDGPYANGSTVLAGGGVDTGNPSTATATFGVSTLGNNGGGITDLYNPAPPNFNLVTFSYTSEFTGTVVADIINYAYGQISDELESFAVSEVYVSFDADGFPYEFTSKSNGDWTLTVDDIPVDFGLGSGIFNVPEPATLALLGLGVAGIAYRRRQVKAA